MNINAKVLNRALYTNYIALPMDPLRSPPPAGTLPPGLPGLSAGGPLCLVPRRAAHLAGRQHIKIHKMCKTNGTPRRDTTGE